MPEYEETATWAALAAAGLAALLFAVACVLLVRWRRAAARELAAVRETSPHAEFLVAEVRAALDRVAGRRQPADAVAAIAFTLDLDEALERALRAGAGIVAADAALILLRRGDDEPIVATYGLSAREASADLARAVSETAGARAIKLDYVYTEEEAANDAFRIAAGVAVPLASADGESVGTLAVFWRRAGVALDDAVLRRCEELAEVFGPALENGRRFRDARRLADTDFVTGLRNRRYFHERLAAECARASRYGRALALLLFDLTSTATPHTLGEAGDRVRDVVRASDVPCHLGEGTFAVIVLEATRTEADRLHRRLQFAVGPPVDSPSDRVRLLAAIAELAPGEDARSLYGRAAAVLERALDAERALRADPR